MTAVGIAPTGLVLEALFRAARLQSLQTYDAWAFWVPKAKAIYFFGGLDEQVFTTAPGPSYPPLLPILDAASFHAMGGADVVTLHLQFWFLVAGGVAAIVACLHARVPAWLLWPSILLVLVVPRFGERLLTPQADVLADLLFAVAVLLVALWVRDGDTWRLTAATLLLAAAALTKAGRRAVRRLRRRRCGRRVLGTPPIGLAASACRRRDGRRGRAPVAALVRGARHSERRALHGRDADAGRLWGSLRLSADVLYSNALWSVVPIVASVALVACAVWGDRRLALPRVRARPPLSRRRLGDVRLHGAPHHRGRGRQPDRPLHRCDRAPRGVRHPVCSSHRCGEATETSCDRSPARVGGGWRSSRSSSSGTRPSCSRTGRASRSQDDCVRIAPDGSTEALDLVFGRRDTPAAAEELRDQVAGVGYVDAEVRPDGCARWKILYDGIESYAQGLESRAEARGAGLEAELEIEPPG